MKANKKNLVFTSAGDSSNVKQWYSLEKNYDIFVVYFGNSDFEQKKYCDFYLERKGGKFQNFYFIYKEYKELISSYDAFFIIDDDIILESLEINKLFSIREEYLIDILQPSFDVRGKISHSITKFNPLTFLRFTNFVEVGVPIFSSRALHCFFEKFDPIVNCCGVDWWYCNVIQHNFKDAKIAITDEITCLNPHDINKNGSTIREIDKFSNANDRIQNWKRFKKSEGLTFQEDKYITYKSIYRISIKNMFKYIYLSVSNFFLRIYRKLRVL